VWTPYECSGKADAEGVQCQQTFTAAAYAVDNPAAGLVNKFKYDLEVISALSSFCGLQTLSITSDGAAVNRQIAKDACESASAERAGATHISDATALIL
jgi:hypothetical protein